MADVDDAAQRADLLADLEILNMDLARLGVVPLVSDAAASLFPPAELPALVDATRRHLRTSARELGGLI